MLKRALQSLLLVVLAVTMLGVSDSTTRLDRIGHELMCQCGCGQILSECNHVGCPVSGPMLDSLRAQIAQGKTESAILQTFIDKYGPIVLASPIRGGFDTVAWIAPLVIVILGGGTVLLVLRLWHNRHQRLAAAGTLPPPPPDELRERIRRETTEEL